MGDIEQLPVRAQSEVQGVLGDFNGRGDPMRGGLDHGDPIVRCTVSRSAIGDKNIAFIRRHQHAQGRDAGGDTRHFFARPHVDHGQRVCLSQCDKGHGRAGEGEHLELKHGQFQRGHRRFIAIAIARDQAIVDD